MADAVGLAMEAVILRLSLRDLADEQLFAAKVRACPRLAASKTAHWPAISGAYQAVLVAMSGPCLCGRGDATILSPTVQLQNIPDAPVSVEQWATSLLWPTAEEVRAELQQEVEGGGSGDDRPDESPVFIRSVRGDADACDGLLCGRRAENALLTRIEVCMAAMGLVTIEDRTLNAGRINLTAACAARSSGRHVN